MLPPSLDTINLPFLIGSLDLMAKLSTTLFYVLHKLSATCIQHKKKKKNSCIISRAGVGEKQTPFLYWVALWLTIWNETFKCHSTCRLNADYQSSWVSFGFRHPRILIIKLKLIVLQNESYAINKSIVATVILTQPQLTMQYKQTLSM